MTDQDWDELLKWAFILSALTAFILMLEAWAQHFLVAY